MKKYILTVIAACVAFTAFAQGPDIQKYVTLLNNGGADQVKADLPGLLSSYPNNPGVLYVQGRLTGDGPEAVRIYQSIVDNFPKSEYAEDALYRVYQFYYALGLYRTADLKLNQLKQDYPNSKLLLSIGTQAPKAAAGEPPSPAAVAAPNPALQPVAEAQVKPAAEKAVTPSAQPVAEAPFKPAVQPPAVTAARPAVKPAAETPANGAAKPAVNFALQVGVFSTAANAEKERKYFEGIGYTSEVVSKTRDSKSVFIVFAGSFPTYDAAKAASEEVKKKYSKNSFPVSR